MLIALALTLWEPTHNVRRIQQATKAARADYNLTALQLYVRSTSTWQTLSLLLGRHHPHRPQSHAGAMELRRMRSSTMYSWSRLTRVTNVYRQ